MTTLALVRDGAADPGLFRTYVVEYTSSEHRGIIMYSEAHNAPSAESALAYAKSKLPEIESNYGARGYRVKNADGRSHASDENAAPNSDE